MRPGLVSVTFRQLSPREIVALAVGCGLEGIEWGGDVHVTNAQVARETRRSTEDAGLEVAAFGYYWRAGGDFEPALETAVALGAPTIRVWAGTKGSVGVADREPVADALRAACELAIGAGRTVSLEYHEETLTDTLDSTLGLVAEIDHPALRVYWQPTPGRPHEVSLREVGALLPLLSHLHVFQWTKPRADVLRHPLQEGEKDWPELLRLGEGDRFALLEFVPGDDPALLAREADTLRRWISFDDLT